MRFSLSIAIALVGCATSTTPAPDAGSDAARSAEDVGPDTSAPDASCDLTPVPSPIPAFTGDFQLNDAVAGTMVPVMTGGDPTGVWVFDHGTFWVDLTNNAMFNRWGSSVAGSAWLAVDAHEFRLDYDFITTLAGTEAGTIVQDNHTRVRARWRLDREQIEPTGLVCGEYTASGVGDPGRVTFTRTGDQIVVLTVVPLETGMTIIELHGTLAP